MGIEYILNGRGSGSVASKLLKNNMDINCLRPYFGANGNTYQTIWNSKSKTYEAKQVINADTTLRKDEWIELDDAVVKVARERLKVVKDLTDRGLVKNIANGLGKTVLQTETQSDTNDAKIAMSPAEMSDSDRPVYSLTNMPLPVIFKDFSYEIREIAASRNGNTPLDTTAAEQAAQKVAEQVEKLLLGRTSSYAYGGGTVYGYTNYTIRLTYTLTAPTASGWTGATLLGQILAMKTLLQAAKHYGPYMVYVSPNWDAYLDNDFSTAKGSNTLRDRIAQIEGVERPKTIDWMQTYDIVMVQMTSNVVRMINGLPMTTVQWDTKGGMEVHFKVMTIQVPNIRADYNSNTGICHGATA